MVATGMVVVGDAEGIDRDGAEIGMVEGVTSTGATGFGIAITGSATGTGFTSAEGVTNAVAAGEAVGEP